MKLNTVALSAFLFNLAAFSSQAPMGGHQSPVRSNAANLHGSQTANENEKRLSFDLNAPALPESMDEEPALNPHPLHSIGTPSFTHGNGINQNIPHFSSFNGNEMSRHDDASAQHSVITDKSSTAQIHLLDFFTPPEHRIPAPQSSSRSIIEDDVTLPDNFALHHEQSFHTTNRLADLPGSPSRHTKKRKHTDDQTMSKAIGTATKRLKVEVNYTIPPRSVEQLMLERPLKRSHPKRLEKWTEAFDSHPDVQSLDTTKEAKHLEEDLRKLRGNITDSVMLSTLTKEVSRNLRARKVPESKVRAVIDYGSRHLDRIRKRRNYEDKVNRIKQEGTDAFEAFRKKEAEQKERSRNNKLRNFEKKEAELQAIVGKLMGKDLNQEVNVEEMERATRSILDEHEDVHISRQALQLYLLQMEHPLDYAKDVSTLSSLIHSREKRTQREKKRTEVRRNKKIALLSPSSSHLASTSTRSTSVTPNFAEREMRTTR